MKYTVSITKKGQMTLPQEVREALGVYIPGKVGLDFNKKTKQLRVGNVSSFLELGRTISVQKHKRLLKKHGAKSILDFRVLMEKHYIPFVAHFAENTAQNELTKG